MDPRRALYGYLALLDAPLKAHRQRTNDDERCWELQEIGAEEAQVNEIAGVEEDISVLVDSHGEAIALEQSRRYGTVEIEI